MKAGRTLQELAIELDRQVNAKRDLIIDTQAIQMDTRENDLSLLIDFNAPGADRVVEQFNINDITHRQIGQHLKIPATYYDRMRTENPSLLTENVNSWLFKEPARRMIRTLDGTARAFLSDRYRRIDNYEVAQAVSPSSVTWLAPVWRAVS